jgi:hypothetical protein
MAANLRSMPNWLNSLWSRVRGNLEAAVILFLLGLVMTAFTLLTRGLQWWQQAILIALFFSVVVWAIIATIFRRTAKASVLQTTTVTGIPGALSASDPRVYLVEILDRGDAMFPATLFVLENLGGDVAHHVQIQTLAFGYSKVDFLRLDNLPLNVTKEVTPRVRGERMGRESVLGVLREAWNDKGKAENTILPNFEFSVIISYSNFTGDRRIETTVDMTYSYMEESLKRNAKLKEAMLRHKIFEIVQTRFRLLPN